MRKLLLQGVLFSLLTLGFASCESDDKNEPWIEPEVTTTGIYILNNGNWGDNDAKLSYYNVDTKTITADVFYNKNGQNLGDQGQDMTIYGSKMYITVTGSNKIFITDRSAKLLKTIDPKNGDQPMQPRFTKAYNGKVYVTTQSGYVLRIDTTSIAVDKQVKSGSFPEQMVIVNNNLYVTNSRNKSDSISVINLATFTKTDKIKVGINPDLIANDKYNNIYVISKGDYVTVRPVLQKINSDTKAVTVIGTDIATQMAVSGDKLFLSYTDPTDYSGTATAKLYYYDITKGELVKQSFVTPPSVADLDKASVISIDPSNSDIYISTTDYVTKGSVYVFSSKGEYKTKFSSEGLNPMGAFFLTETK